MRELGFALGFTCVLLLGTPAVHASTIYGSASLLTARDCSLLTAAQDCIPNASHGGAIVPRVYASYLGGAGAALNTSVSNAYGQWQVGTGANPGGLPILKGGSWSGSNTRLNTNAVVFQQFTYTGTTVSPFSLIGNLDFDSSGNDGLDETGSVGGGGQLSEQAGEGGIFAQMFLMATSAFDGVTSAEQVMDLLGLDCSDSRVGAMVAFSPLGFSQGNHQTQLKLDMNCAGQAMTLSPGDTGVLVMALQTSSNRGGYTDATHTFVSAIDPDLPDEVVRQLQANFVPLSPRDLPEPSTLGLLLSASFGALVVARRRWS